MFIMKAFAENTKESSTQRFINKTNGIGKTNPQTRYYLRTGTSGLGATKKTKGRPAAIRLANRGR